MPKVTRLPSGSSLLSQVHCPLRLLFLVFSPYASLCIVQQNSTSWFLLSASLTTPGSFELLPSPLCFVGVFLHLVVLCSLVMTEPKSSFQAPDPALQEKVAALGKEFLGTHSGLLLAYSLVVGNTATEVPYPFRGVGICGPHDPEYVQTSEMMVRSGHR